MKTSTYFIMICILVATSGSAFFPKTDNRTLLSDNLISGMDVQQKKAVVPSKTEYTCPMHPEIIRDKPGKCPKCGMTLVKKEVPKVVYTCPMHPEVIRDKEGKCPKCGMNLVKKEPVKKQNLLKNHNSEDTKRTQCLDGYWNIQTINFAVLSIPNTIGTPSTICSKLL